MVSKKRQLGQFFTKNSDYILNGFSRYVGNKNVTDPFAGGQDLIQWAKKHNAKKTRGFDIDPQYIDNNSVFENDSINNFQSYEFVLTNPPYLHKNKAPKEIKEKYFADGNSQFEDLYQVSINSVLNSKEGILIVPLNFLSAENSKKIRNIFFDKFKIISLNIFQEKVFDDTTYNVISLYYKRRKKQSDISDINVIRATIFPSRQKIKLILNKKYGWQLGGESAYKINLTENSLGIYRLTEKHIKKGSRQAKLAYTNIKQTRNYSLDENFLDYLRKNIIFLRAIDSKNGHKIKLEDIRQYKVNGLVGKNTSRNMAHLLFKEQVPVEAQEKLIDYFNKELENERKRNLSLFLTNFRDNGRKRISFEAAYKFINYLYFNKLRYSKLV